MIKKHFRLKEREVKKVLGKSKPFFSNGIVLNKKFNRKNFNRFAIVIGAKSVNTNVTRVFFRRKFYDKIKDSIIFGEKYINSKYYDFVFVVKKQTKLNRKNSEAIKSFENDLNFLIKKVK